MRSYNENLHQTRYYVVADEEQKRFKMFLMVYFKEFVREKKRGSIALFISSKGTNERKFGKPFSETN